MLFCHAGSVKDHRLNSVKSLGLRCCAGRGYWSLVASASPRHGPRGAATPILPTAARPLKAISTRLAPSAVAPNQPVAETWDIELGRGDPFDFPQGVVIRS